MFYTGMNTLLSIDPDVTKQIDLCMGFFFFRLNVRHTSTPSILPIFM